MALLKEPGDSLMALLSDRFEFLDYLGEGGFASVYKVRNLRLKRPEAMKILKEKFSEDSRFALRFRHEAETAAALDHPNIVKVYDFGITDGHPWFSMQYIDGMTLEHKLVLEGSIEEIAACRLAITILDALGYSHSKGVIHRDIKPPNIVLDSSGRPYVMDFGIARTEDDAVKTATGVMLGSPSYVSPEQVRGLKIDARTDIYSFGITFYEMLTGSLPFVGDGSMATATRRLFEDPEPVRHRLPSLDSGVEQIVMKALAREQASRYASAGAMKLDIEHLLARKADLGRMTAPLPGRPLPGRLPPGFESLPTGSFLPSSTEALEVPVLDLVKEEHGPLPEPQSAPVPVPPIAVQPGPATPPEKAVRWRIPAIVAGIALAAFLAGRFLTAPDPDRQETAPGAITTAPLEGTPAARSHPSPATPVEPAEMPPVPVTKPSQTVAPKVREDDPPRPTSPVAQPQSTPVTVRRAKYPPDVEEVAPIVIPSDLQEACRDRSVGVAVVIDEAGLMKGRKVISSVSEACDRLALEALERYRFKPALDEQGKPVEGRFSFAVRF